MGNTIHPRCNEIFIEVMYQNELLSKEDHEVRYSGRASGVTKTSIDFEYEWLFE